MENNDFVKGALIGGFVGGLAALLLTPKAGKDLRDSIAEGYHSLQGHAQKYSDEGKKKVEDFIDSIHDIDQHDTTQSFLVGGASGAIIGAVAALLLAPQAGKKLRSQLGDSYDEIREKAKCVVDGMKSTKECVGDKLEEWKDIFETIVSKISATAEGKSPQSKHLNKIMDWATLGLRLYDQIQARR